MEILLQKYLLAQELKGCRPQTIETQRFHLSQFLSDLADRGITELANLSLETIRDIIKSRGWQASTAAARLTTFKAFLHFLVREGALAKNPLSEFKMRSGPEKHYYILRDQEIDQVRQATGTLPLAGQVAINLFLDTGARNGELLFILAKNINLDKKSILLEHTKGGRERYSFFSDHTKGLLEKYLPSIQDGGRIFPYTQNWTRALLRRVIGIAFPDCNDQHHKMTPHSLRHSFVTSFIRRKGSVQVLRRIVGWSSLKMLDKYEHMNEDELAEGYQNYQNNGGAVAVKG